jgi:hypothetical protein
MDRACAVLDRRHDHVDALPRGVRGLLGGGPVAPARQLGRQRLPDARA